MSRHASCSLCRCSSVFGWVTYKLQDSLYDSMMADTIMVTVSELCFITYGKSRLIYQWFFILLVFIGIERFSTHCMTETNTWAKEHLSRTEVSKTFLLLAQHKFHPSLITNARSQGWSNKNSFSKHSLSRLECWTLGWMQRWWRCSYTLPSCVVSQS